MPGTKKRAHVVCVDKEIQAKQVHGVIQLHHPLTRKQLLDKPAPTVEIVILGLSVISFIAKHARVG